MLHAKRIDYFGGVHPADDDWGLKWDGSTRDMGVGGKGMVFLMDYANALYQLTNPVADLVSLT